MNADHQLDTRGSFARLSRRSFDQISLHGLRVDCIIGLYDRERLTSQSLEVDLTLGLPSPAGGFRGELEDSIDYARVAGLVQFTLEAGQFRHLESAAEAIAHLLLAPPHGSDTGRRPSWIELQLRKPAALHGRATPAVKIYREADALSFEEEQSYFGPVDILYERADCGVYRLRIPAGGEIPPHQHHELEEAELILSPGLLLQELPVSPGLSHFWPKRFTHGYRNPSCEEAAVLCINRPKFCMEDERIIEDFVLHDVTPYRRRYFEA